MVCVLRIGGSGMNMELARQSLSVEPYRVDTQGKDGARVSCMHYDIAGEDRDDVDYTLSCINGFLDAHGDELKTVADVEGVEFRLFDIGLFLGEDRISVSIELDEALIQRLSELGMSVSISAYLVSPS